MAGFLIRWCLGPVAARLLCIAATGILTAAAHATTIEGYAWPPSVAQGGTLSLHVSTHAPTFDVEFTRDGALSIPYLTLTDIPGGLQAVPDSAWLGCDWAPSTSLVIPTDWPSGVYMARLQADGAADSYAIFTVREDFPGSTGRILVQNSINTWQAYNPYGGKGLYGFLSTNNQRAHQVSFQRPYFTLQGRGQYLSYEQPLVQWLEAEGFAVEYCTNLDLHADPTLLANYDLFISVGHDEYWSKQMRNQVEGFVASGGNVAFLGGNSCWWQVRMSNDLDLMTCYKDRTLDPLDGVQNELVTVRWREPPLDLPENTLTGASYANGGNASAGTGGYTVWRPSHWLLDGTGLQYGEEFGAENSVVGGEVDGALFDWQMGVPVPTGTDGTPANFTILGTALGTTGHATFGVMEDSTSTVFNAATMTWSFGLYNNDAVRRITDNLVTTLVNGNPYAPRDGALVLDDVDWSVIGSDIQFTLRFRNDTLLDTSRRTEVRVASQELGSLAAEIAVIGTLEVPPLAPGDTHEQFWQVPIAQLPATVPILIDGQAGDVPGCSPGNTWSGQIDIQWTEAGVSSPGHERRGIVSLPVCPGSAASAVALTVQPAAGEPWSFSGPPTGWSANLLRDDAGAPGDSSPNPLTAATYAAWITVAADSGVAVGSPGETVLTLGSGPTAARIRVMASACACQDPVGVEPAAGSLSLRLHPIQPNPFQESAMIRFDLPHAARVDLRVFDVAGRLVRTLDGSRRGAGAHHLLWDGRDGTGRQVSPGVYFVRLNAGSDGSTRRVVHWK